MFIVIFIIAALQPLLPFISKAASDVGIQANDITYLASSENKCSSDSIKGRIDLVNALVSNGNSKVLAAIHNFPLDCCVNTDYLDACQLIPIILRIYLLALKIRTCPLSYSWTLDLGGLILTENAKATQPQIVEEVE